MNFKYFFHQIPYSEFLIKAVENKIGHSMRYHFGLGGAQVSFGRKGHNFTISISIKGQGNVYYKAEATSENLYTAIDLVQDKLEKQFTKHRKKIQYHKNFARSKMGRMKNFEKEFIEYQEDFELKAG